MSKGKEQLDSDLLNLTKREMQMVVGKHDACNVLLLFLSNECKREFIRAFLSCVLVQIHALCHMINFTFSVFTEKHRTSLFSYKLRPTGSVCTKRPRSDIS